MKCPTCPETLRVERAGGGEIAICPGCGGTFLTHAELHRWTREESNPQSVRDSLVPMPFSPDAHEVNCPSCDVPMDRFHRVSTDMAVDLCSRCEALWIGEEELAKAPRAKESTPNAFERVALRLLGVVEALHDWHRFEDSGKRQMHLKLIQAILTLERAGVVRADEARELVDLAETPAGGEEAVRLVELEGYVEMLYRARLISREQYEDKKAMLRARGEA